MLDLLLLRKIISAFIVPPGLFVLLMLAAVALLCGRRRRAAAFFVLVTLVMLFLFSSRAGEFFLVRTLEDDFVPLSFRELADMRNDGIKTAVVVLSGDAVRGSPAGGSLAAEIGEVTLKRLFEGYRVYRVTGFPLCVSGGVEPGAEGASLAEVMKAALVDMGVPGDKIIEEGSSRTTLENAVRTLGILEKQGYRRIILVTDAVHMKRALMVFEGKGMEVVSHPSGYLYEDTPGILDWLPNRDSLEANVRAAHEWAGLWYYKLLDKL